MMKSCTPLFCQWLIEWSCQQLTWTFGLAAGEERKKKRREEKRKTISSVVPSLRPSPFLSRYPLPHISHTRTKQEKVQRLCGCSKDLYHDIKRGRRGEENVSWKGRRGYRLRGGNREGGEKVKEEMTYTWDNLCLYLSVHLHQHSLALCTTHLLALKGRKKQNTEGWKEDKKQKKRKKKITKQYKPKYHKREEVF